jgi:hypothetical protein
LAYWSAVVSFLVLVLFIVLKTLHHTAQLTLFSEAIDTIIYETMIVSAGTFLATALIGIIYEKFQTKIVRDSTLVRERFVDEGILRVFKSAGDPKLLEFLQSEIGSSKSEVIAVGLGLGILAHNPQLLEAIAEKVNNIDNFRLKIFFGSSNNNGVKNRIQEEKTYHDNKNLNYDESWIQRYPSEMNGVLKSLINDNREHKFTIKEIDTCPMVSLIKIDNTFLFFPYGTPNIKGSRSPWIEVDGNADNSSMVKFLKDIIKFYE